MIRSCTILLSVFALARGIRLFGDYLRPAGYRTGLVGKWHLGTMAGCLPLERGFDSFYGFLGDSSPYFPPAKAKTIANIFEGREPQPVWAVRQGDLKLAKEVHGDRLKEPPGKNTSAAKTSIRLYSLSEDLAEGNDLSARQPEKRRELQVAYDAWCATLPAPFTTGKPPARK